MNDSHATIPMGSRLQHDIHIFKDMSLRDYFASAALTGLLAGQHNRAAKSSAESAYEMADAMLQEREKRND